MSTFIRADEAARILGVTKATLYAYVSRGMIDRRTAIDGRTSLYDRDDLTRLAGRARGRRPVEQPSIDVAVSSRITVLHDDRLTYFGHDAAELSVTSTYEQVAELLWSGTLPSHTCHWRVDRSALDRCRSLLGTGSQIDDGILRLAIAASVLADGADQSIDQGDTDTGNPAQLIVGPAEAARRLLSITPSLLGGPLTGSFAERLARAWCHRPDATIVTALSRALILLADHELATSTLAVRVAASVRTDPYSAIAAGLHTVRGPLHGGASAEVAKLLNDIHADPAALESRLAGREQRIAGFGHMIYRNGDPRVTPLLTAVEQIPGALDRQATVASVRSIVTSRLALHPNIDFAVGALLFVAEMPPPAPIFAVARIAGWAAHMAEELEARPLRYRGLAKLPPA